MKNPITQGPMTVGQLFDRAFRLYQKNFWTLIGIVGVAQLVSFVGQVLVSSGQLIGIEAIDGAGAGGIIAGSAAFIFGIIFSIAAGLISLLSAGAIARATGQALFAETFTLRSVYRDVLPRFGTLFWLAILILLIGIALMIYTVIPILGWLTGFGMAIFFGVIGSIAVPAIILEDAAAYPSLRRMWDLAKQRFWPVIGFVFLIGIMTYIFVGSLTGVASIGLVMVMATDPSMQIIIGAQIVQAAITTIMTTVITPFTLVANTLLYLDLRVRFEGLDLTVAQSEGESSAAVLSKIPSNEQGPLVQWSDLTKFAILSTPFFIIVCGMISLITGLTLMEDQIGDVFNGILSDLEN